MICFKYNNKDINYDICYKNKEQYFKEKEKLLTEQMNTRFDHDIVLNKNEERLNRSLLKLKELEIKEYTGNHFFPPSKPFWQVKKYIDASPLFSLIKKMPKGAVLHVHSSAMGSPENLIELTYIKNCYMFTENNSSIPYGKLKFFNPSTVPVGWETLDNLRANDADFDEKLLELITLGKDDSDSLHIWDKFNEIFIRINELVNYYPAAMLYFTKSLQNFINDNIIHVEIRSSLNRLYDLNGNYYDALETFIPIIKNYPMISVRFIYSSHRNKSKEEIWSKMENAIKLRKAYPELIAGFDLVGEEDAGHNTSYFLDNFLNIDELTEKYEIDLPYFFHNGESDWVNDKNLYDAVLLGSKRIGHGYNLFYFPILESLLRFSNTPLELCPISNQVLGYIEDLRDHPAAGYLNRGIPLTLNSDDPAILGYSGVSYDYWEAFMAWDLDLRSLKKFALNSIELSSLDDDTKAKKLRNLESKWNYFVSRSNAIL